MRDVRLDVHPAAYGWELDVWGEEVQSLVFQSAAQAGAQARALARALAIAGHDVCVIVHDRRNRAVETTRYSAQPRSGVVLAHWR